MVNNMLESVKISRRQLEIRQSLADLAAKPEPTEDETRSMDTLDREYRANETRYRAALVSEDTERREAGAELETREGRQWDEVVSGFEVRQVAAVLASEGRALSGQTAEVVEELRTRGSFEGIPVPLEALETRAGETVSGFVPEPKRVAPIIDRLFADSMIAQMGGRVVNVGVGVLEYPVVTSAISAGWAGELDPVPGPQAFRTVEKPLKPGHDLGVVVEVTRTALQQAGTGLEQAIRRDLSGTIREKLDAAAFLGTGNAGQPLGVIAGAGTGSGKYGITETPVGAAASYAAFRAAAVRFMTANAASGPNALRLMLRPEVFGVMDDTVAEGLGETEWDRLTAKLGGVVLTSNALAAPAGNPKASKALLTVTTGGVAPFYVGTWGAVDMIRDPYTKAPAGIVRLTAITTADVTVGRPQQLEVLTGVQ